MIVTGAAFIAPGSLPCHPRGSWAGCVDDNNNNNGGRPGRIESEGEGDGLETTAHNTDTGTSAYWPPGRAVGWLRWW